MLPSSRLLQLRVPILIQLRRNISTTTSSLMTEEGATPPFRPRPHQTPEAAKAHFEKVCEASVIPRDYFDPSRILRANPEKSEGSAWRSISGFTVATVGLLSKFWATKCNSLCVFNVENFTNLLDHREPDRGLITVTNHISCMDDPLLWGMLDVRHLTSWKTMRWVLSAHDIVYSNLVHAKFFTYGKSIPIVRGLGVYQPGMDYCLERLNNGAWVHIYPEGKVNTDPSNEIRLKWGVGRLCADAKKPPILLPFYHLGMDSILPNVQPYIPHFGKKITIVIGEPLDYENLLTEMTTRGASEEEKRTAIAEMIQKSLRKLRIEALIKHANHQEEKS